MLRSAPAAKGTPASRSPAGKAPAARGKSTPQKVKDSFSHPQAKQDQPSTAVRLGADASLATQAGRRVVGPAAPRPPSAKGPAPLRQTRLTDGARNSGVTRGANVLGAGASFVGAGLSTRDALQDWKAARANGNYAKATSSTLSATSAGLQGTVSAVEAKRTISTYRALRGAGMAAPTRKPVTAAAKKSVVKAATNAYLRAPEKLEQKAVSKAVLGAAKQAAPTALKNGLGRPVSKAVVEAGERVAAKKVATTLAAKAAARFVPGANIAIAAMDVANAAATWKDPTASGMKKTTAIVTAVGSSMAATNIPVVSQAGAVISTASSLLGSIFG